MGLRVQTLSDRERECLRLVADNRQSKEIARVLGISKRTVDGYCDTARAKLEVADRFEAARLLKAFETLPYRITGDTIRMDAELDSLQEMAATTEAVGVSGDKVGETRTSFVHDASPPDLLAVLPLSSERRPYNDLNRWQRLVTIGWITGKMIFYLALILLAAETLSRLAYKLAG